LKQFLLNTQSDTGLKPGVNEISDRAVSED
jgi:hypothetical protein